MLDEGGSVKFFQRGPITFQGKKGIMFLRSSAGQGLKPVCKMGNPFGFGPGPDPVGDLARYGAVDLLTFFYAVNQAFISFVAQVLAGDLEGKYVVSEYVGNTRGASRRGLGDIFS